MDVRGEYLGNNMEGGAGRGFSGGGGIAFDEDAFGPSSRCFFDLPATVKRGYLHGIERKRMIRESNRGINGEYLCEACEERTGAFETAAAATSLGSSVLSRPLRLRGRRLRC